MAQAGRSVLPAEAGEPDHWLIFGWIFSFSEHQAMLHHIHIVSGCSPFAPNLNTILKSSGRIIKQFIR
ncbi:MAG: hypothetical protein HY774_17880 [Acidobacteria bacterium]|nr:hypothetical protein [Acidobacteriota bacterium]